MNTNVSIMSDIVSPHVIISLFAALLLLLLLRATSMNLSAIKIII